MAHELIMHAYVLYRVSVYVVACLCVLCCKHVNSAMFCVYCVLRRTLACYRMRALLHIRTRLAHGTTTQHAIFSKILV